MTTTTVSTEAVFAGDGVTDTFLFTFPAGAESEVRNLVGIGAAAVAAAATVTLNEDQSTNPGGVVVFDTPPANEGAANILIYRDTAIVQETSYPTRGPFPSRVVEFSFDKLTRIVQELATKLGRAVVAVPAASGSPSALTLPAPEVGKALGWGAGGTLTNIDAGGGGGSGGLLPLTAGAVYTVGPTGDYTTLGAALADLAYFVKVSLTSGVEVELQIESGVTVAEQIVIDGVDLSFVRITSVDATVPVSRAALTNPVTIYAAVESVVYPFITVRNSGVSPVISALFVCDTSGAAAQRIGLLADTNGDCQIKGATPDYAGFEDFPYNLYALNNASVVGHLVSFDSANAVLSGMQAANCARVSLNGARIDSAAGGIIAATGAVVTVYAGALSADSGPTVAAAEGEVVLKALATLATAGGNASPVLLAQTGRIIAKDLTLTNAGSTHAVQAEFGGHINVENSTISGTTAPANDVHIADGSVVVANNATTSQPFNVAVNTLSAAGIIYG